MSGNGSGGAVVKRWEPKHDYIVALRLAGKEPKDIAPIVGLTPNRVSHILRDPKAKELLEQAQKSIVSNVIEGISGRLVTAAEKSMERLEETLNQPIPATSRAKVHQDRVALDILKGTGFLRRDHEGHDREKKTEITEKTAHRLATAMEKSNEVLEKWGGNVEENVLEGEFDVIEEPNTGAQSPEQESPQN